MMKKMVLVLLILVGFLDAAEVAKSVTTCSFSRKQLAAFADIPMVCSGDYKNNASTQELYTKGWRLINSYTHGGETYLVFEK